MADALKISADLLQIRETARAFFGQEYEEKLKPFLLLLDTYMDASGKEALEAAKTLCGLQSTANNDMAKVMFMAAAVKKLSEVENIQN